VLSSAAGMCILVVTGNLTRRGSSWKVMCAEMGVRITPADGGISSKQSELLSVLVRNWFNSFASAVGAH
jgi:hypothetical protein